MVFHLWNQRVRNFFNFKGKKQLKNVGQQLFNYYDTWDIIDQEFMDNLGGYLKRKSKYNEINRQIIN